MAYDGWTQAPLLSDIVGTETAVRRDHLHAIGPQGTPVGVAQNAPGEPREALIDDGNGTLATAVNVPPAATSGSVVCQARLDPWGNPAGNFDLAGADPDRYCASGASMSDVGYRMARRDPTTGDYQFGVRTYAPETAAFSTPDSWAHAPRGVDLSVTTDPLTRNRYQYALADPINLMDLTGHSVCETSDCDSGQTVDTQGNVHGDPANIPPQHTAPSTPLRPAEGHTGAEVSSRPRPRPRPSTAPMVAAPDLWIAGPVLSAPSPNGATLGLAMLGIAIRPCRLCPPVPTTTFEWPQVRVPDLSIPGFGNGMGGTPIVLLDWSRIFGGDAAKRVLQMAEDPEEWPVQQGGNCRECAEQIQDLIGGSIRQIHPEHGQVLGPSANNPDGDWSYHDVVIEGDRVYDSYTGPDGLPIDEYREQFEYADDINFDF